MNMWDTEWWMAVIAAGITLGALLVSIRSAVSKRQRELRGRLREVLRSVSTACNDYPIEARRRTASRMLAEASDELKVIQDEGILSPSARQIHELQMSVYDLATKDEGNAKFIGYAGLIMSPDERVDLAKNLQGNTDRMHRYVTRLSENYRRATTRMDNGNVLTYWRYRVLPPFIVRR